MEAPNAKRMRFCEGDGEIEQLNVDNQGNMNCQIVGGQGAVTIFVDIVAQGKGKGKGDFVINT